MVLHVTPGSVPYHTALGRRLPGSRKEGWPDEGPRSDDASNQPDPAGGRHDVCITHHVRQLSNTYHTGQGLF